MKICRLWIWNPSAAKFTAEFWNLSIGCRNLTPVEVHIEDTQFGLGPLSLEFLKSKITVGRLRHSWPKGWPVSYWPVFYWYLSTGIRKRVFSSIDFQVNLFPAWYLRRDQPSPLWSISVDNYEGCEGSKVCFLFNRTRQLQQYVSTIRCIFISPWNGSSQQHTMKEKWMKRNFKTKSKLPKAFL